jgi:Ser/Thr protein kinase RdoA (MazF antagonist)|tara:strand:+ start:8772 stop:9386 length:615 start_codon:yes stop_codon:yes gene_type:complete
MPTHIASEDHESSPILILEDLSGYHWPPPWRDGDVEAVLAQIANIHATLVDLPTHEELHGRRPSSWQTVADNVQPFVDLGLATPSWLQQSLPHLLAAEARCETAGQDLTHWDIRSDNICICHRTIKLIDWNNACLGNPKLDLGFWLPSLAYEGGPVPESVSDMNQKSRHTWLDFLPHGLVYQVSSTRQESGSYKGNSSDPRCPG